MTNKPEQWKKITEAIDILIPPGMDLLCPDGDSRGIRERLEDAIAKEIDTVKSDTIAKAIEVVEKGFEEGHGGGNWRRLLIQVIAKLKEL